MMRVRLPPCCRTLVLVLIAVPGAFTQSQQFEGRQISEIIFDPADQPVAQVDLERILPLKVHSALHMADVRKAIDQLYATGRYEYIEVSAEPAGSNDVAVRILTRNRWFIGRVSIAGSSAEPPTKGQMVNVTKLDLGQPFVPGDMKNAEERVRALLVSNGFYEAVVTSSLEYSEIAEQVNITFLVETGKRSTFWVPKLTGDIQLPEKKIISATKWKKWFNRGWHPLTQARLRDGLDHVRDKFQKNDRLLATVQLDSLDYDGANHRVSPELAIQAGPEVSVKAIGAKVKRKQLEQNIPVFQEHAVDNDLLEEGRQNLTDEFQAKGYFEATVVFKELTVANGKQEIQYLITPGDLHNFVKVTISGNKYFQTDAIRERMFLTPKSFQYRHGRYSRAFVRRDEQSIAALYKSNGFRDVVVKAETIDNYSGRVGDVAAEIKITEGPQYLVSKLTIEGTEQISLDKIRPMFNVSIGQPFSEYSIASDRSSILTYYSENGFPNATFEFSAAPGVKPTDVEVTYRIVEGVRETVRRVIVSGMKRVKPKLVNRQISLGPNKPLSPVQMSEAQKRLYDLGIFAKVDMAIQNPDGSEQDKYIVYNLEEARSYSVTTGFGAQLANIGGSNAATSLSDPAGAAGFSPRVSLDVTRLDVRGLGHTVSVRSRYSSLDKRVVVDYLAPRIFDWQRFDANFAVLYDQSNDVRTYTGKREEGSVQLTHRISKSLTGFYKFSYRRVDVSNLKISPSLLPLLAQSNRTGMLSANFIQDRRDDPTDAHRGIYNTVDLGLSAGAFGSQIDFIRILLRNATYHPIGKKLVFARQTTFGWEPAYNIPAGADPTDPLPLPERLYGGGGNSMRGFPENQAGPRDLQTGFPLGGSALLFNTMEMRFPLLRDNIGGVIFHDMGNVFDNLSDISLRFHQNNLQDFKYAVQAVGIGVRYRTPIGPVRFDLAYSLNSPRFNGYSGNYSELVQCSLAGTCVAAPQRVNRIQFFFSIGQAF
jgi:outer membrane protein insertion porin family